MQELIDKLAEQLRFLIEADKLKSVVRRSYLMDGSRRENSAEHSWHAMLAAVLLAEHASEPVDVLRLLKMLVVHDIVEIDAGDTFHFHKTEDNSKEAQAAIRLCGLLPPEQAKEYLDLWKEFELRETIEAKFARGIDRLCPILQNLENRGRSWIDFGIRLEDVVEKSRHMADGSTILWDRVAQMLEDANQAGWLCSPRKD